MPAKAPAARLAVCTPERHSTPPRNPRRYRHRLCGGPRNRVAWIKNLARRALLWHRRDDLKLHLTYAPEAAPDVGLMVEQERAHCVSLTLVLQQVLDSPSLAMFRLRVSS